MSAVERLAEALRPQPLFWEARTPEGGFVMAKVVTPEGAAEHILAADPALADALELGLAWADAEAALPEGWHLRIADTSGESWSLPGWRALGGAPGDDTPYEATWGATPAEALRALAATLRESQP